MVSGAKTWKTSSVREAPGRRVRPGLAGVRRLLGQSTVLLRRNDDPAPTETDPAGRRQRRDAPGSVDDSVGRALQRSTGGGRPGGADPAGAPDAGSDPVGHQYAAHERYRVLQDAAPEPALGADPHHLPDGE